MEKFALQLPADPTAVRDGRTQVRAWLEDHRCRDGCVEVAELVVSELVTNALVHARSAPEIRVAIGAREVRIEVHDHEPISPSVHPPQGAEGGYGLHIVGAVSLDWGWAHTPSGKIVWAEVAL